MAITTGLRGLDFIYKSSLWKATTLLGGGGGGGRVDEGFGNSRTTLTRFVKV